MKKFFMTIVAIMIAVCANAQFYVGGNVGLASVSSGDDDETYYSFLPEVGYNLNRNLSLGIAFGWSKGDLGVAGGNLYTSGSAKSFEVNPYVRYTFLHSKVVEVFFDGTFGYKDYDGDGNTVSLGIKPGVALNFNQHFALVSHIGFVGWQQTSIDNHKDVDVWGVALDGNNITLGVKYTF